MKFQLNIFILLIFLISCGKNSTKEHDKIISYTTIKSEPITKTDSSIRDNSTSKSSVSPLPTNLTSYFEDFQKDTIKIEVEAYTQETSFEPTECLPLSFLPLFEDHVYATQTESIGAKPVGKIKVHDDFYFLVFVQQDDYGPIYYGLAYDKQENKIKKVEKVALIWGDAGDSEEVYSMIYHTDKKIIIEKYIQICHFDLEITGDQVIVSNTDCSDSTKVLELNF
ncbi:MAG: hypothetical protein CMO01_16750 [Thalassobius sp.]|nr:hypothetical protein [Thalassovita sp.]